MCSPDNEGRGLRYSVKYSRVRFPQVTWQGLTLRKSRMSALVPLGTRILTAERDVTDRPTLFSCQLGHLQQHLSSSRSQNTLVSEDQQMAVYVVRIRVLMAVKMLSRLGTNVVQVCRQVPTFQSKMATPSLELKSEKVYSSEKLVSVCRSTRRYNPKGQHLELPFHNYFENEGENFVNVSGGYGKSFNTVLLLCIINHLKLSGIYIYTTWLKV
jgi:hypothetical protein